MTIGGFMEASMRVLADARSEADLLDDLEDEITRLAGHIHAATHRLLLLLAEFDRRGGWKRAGHRSAADWLHFSTGIDLGACREKVRAARALERMPHFGAAMARGEISFSKLRAATRLVDVLDEEGEEKLLGFARECTARELEKVVRGWKLLSRADEAELERRRHRQRYLSVFPDEEGMYLIRGRIPAEVGAVLMRAIEAAADALHHAGEDWAAEGGDRGPRTAEATPRQRRADALGLVAERALQAGFGAGEAGADAGGDQGEEEPGPSAQAPAPLSGTRAERYQVFLHVDDATLSEGEEPGRSHLEDGTRLSAETSRRLTCDASVVRVVHGNGGKVLDVGRRTRTVPPAIRRALEVRDGGCTFPGCGLRFTEAHHIVHWSQGGETNLGNTVLLCRIHHRAVHEEGFRVRRDRDGTLQFFDRTGWPLPDRAPLSRLPGDPVNALIRENRLRGADPAGWACSARYRTEGEVPWRLEAEVWEAIDR
jgi:hypothetical protein